MIIAVAGSGSKVGKTTFCAAFMDCIDRKQWQYLSTSDRLIVELSKKIEVPVGVIKKNKEEYRDQLIALSEDNHTLPIALTLAAWDTKKNLLFESVRRKSEFDVLSQHPATFIYIKSTTNKRIERGAGNTDINEVTDLLLPMGEPIKNCYLVYNNGTMSALKNRARELAKLLT